MTTINNLDDFLQALDANPSWREADRSRILGEELLQLPVRFIAFVNQQEAWNENATIRFNQIEADMSRLKGEYARTRTIQDARGIATDLGLEYIRTLSNADLVIEATYGTDTRFIPMEISLRADQRECSRAIRNAELITRFTGKPAQAAIASVRNDQTPAAAVESGPVYWHPLEDRTPDPE